METEKIDVPKFDGFESFYGDPNATQGLLVLDGLGRKLIPVIGCLKPQICYRKIKPKRIVLECDGIRLPKEGELFLEDGELHRAAADFVAYKHEVYRIVEDQS